MIVLKCSGCGAIYDVNANAPVHGCMNRKPGDGINHVLESVMSEEHYQVLKNDFYSAGATVNPYKAFRKFFYVNALAESLDVDFNEIIDDIDRGLAAINEPAFAETPVRFLPCAGECKGGLYIKDETANVSGSHKARHLMGNMAYLEVLRRSGILKSKPGLAIYSCGNAALGAAAIAKAAGYGLRVFVPPELNVAVTRKLNAYGAEIVECPRLAGETGDPCYNRFQEALEKGAVPFSCAGTDNWSNIEGGKTLGLELFSQVLRQGGKIGSIAIQIGGGALASSAVQAIETLYAAGIIRDLPEIHAVQTEGCYPLARAYCLLMKEIAGRDRLRCSLSFRKEDSTGRADAQNRVILDYLNSCTKEILALSDHIRKNYSGGVVSNVLEEASHKMPEYMWSWEKEPHSIAHGILDDITYDWFSIVRGMFRSGGIPVVVSEQELKDANILARATTGIRADHTGTSGFTGYIKLKGMGIIPDSDASSVIFTGVERHANNVPDAG